MLLKRVISKLDVITATSPVSRSAIDRFASARIVANGIDLDAYGPTGKEPGSVAFLGRDDPRKGLDVLLAAWPIVAEAIDGAKLTVMSAERTSDRDDVEFLGRVTEERKAAVLAGTEVYCAPNLGGESFGIVLAEAMASGCAVVASAIPAFAHVVADTAELVAPGDPEGLAKRIIELLENDERRSNLQGAAFARARQYDGRVVAAIFADAYAEAMAAH
jgi:phosphatidylinositol alpha-mannosyltransferase